MDVGSPVICEGRYYNANGFATAIVAVITVGIDWAAYIGGAPEDIIERKAVEFVAANGCKLSESDARYYFWNAEFAGLPYRR